MLRNLHNELFSFPCHVSLLTDCLIVSGRTQFVITSSWKPFVGLALSGYSEDWRDAGGHRRTQRVGACGEFECGVPGHWNTRRLLSSPRLEHSYGKLFCQYFEVTFFFLVKHSQVMLLGSVLCSRYPRRQVTPFPFSVFHSASHALFTLDCMCLADAVKVKYR